MKRAAISLMVIFGLSLYAQAGPGDKEKAQESKTVSSTKKTELKGPAFKNNRNKATANEESLLSQNKKQNLKGPEFKNQKEYKSTESYIKVKTYTTKGPKYKNQRFKR